MQIEKEKEKDLPTIILSNTQHHSLARLVHQSQAPTSTFLESAPSNLR